MKENEIVKELVRAKKAYYGSDTPLFSDKEFDDLEETLRQLNPLNPYFSMVGSPSALEDKDKILHVIPMVSMAKAKIVKLENGEGDIEKWLKRLALPESTEFLLQPKIDGLSASCYYENGLLQYVATRGDGLEGQNISHIASYMRDIPLQIDFLEPMEVRGELYLPKDTPYDTKGRPLRNNCVGLINRKESREDLKYVEFVTYQVARVSPKSTEGGIIDFLSDLGFRTVTYKVVQSIDEIDSYNQEYLDELRDLWRYETDGLILVVNNNLLHQEIDSRWVVDHHHHYAIAIKPPSDGQETNLIRIEWQVSRQGLLIPVAVFEPIFLGGAKIERASIHNLEHVKHKFHLLKGDRILIERANDVIPYLRANLSDSPSRDYIPTDEIPSLCPSCQSPLKEEDKHLRCPNQNCPERQIQSILYWVVKSGMEQVAESTIRKLYELGLVKTISDLYRLKGGDLLFIEGFGEIKIKNLMEQIEKTRTMDLLDFLAHLGIPMVQKKSLENLSSLRCEAFCQNIFSSSSFLSIEESLDNSEKYFKESISCFNNPELEKTLKMLFKEAYNQWQTDKECKLGTSKKIKPFSLSPFKETLVKKMASEIQSTSPQFFMLNSLDDFRQLENFAPERVLVQKIMEWKENLENQELLDDLEGAIHILEPQKNVSLGEVCMTGKGPLGRKEIVKIIEEKGYTFSSSVTKNTKILLCSDPSGSSSKLVKARKNGIELLSYDEFLG